MSQGREAFVGSLFLCERALQATKPPNPAWHVIKITASTKININYRNESEE
jgi:hypothetical protein